MVKKKKVNRSIEKLKIVAKFLLIFNLLSLPLYVAIYANFSFYPLQVFTASVSNSVLQIIGYDTSLHGNLLVITAKNLLLRVDVSWDSTGWKSLYALAALSVATPVAFDKKIKFLAIALPAIFVVNILRVVTTISLSLIYGLEYFDLLHNLLWREGLIAAVVGIWLVWTYKQKYNIR